MTAPRRLLFVDDEAAILRALERLLRAHRHTWECAFSDDSTKALDLVDAFAPDAVISDMLMPGLDGAAFLTAAATRRPVMARFILSGEVGAGTLVRMAMAAHQCLAKPCRGDVIARVMHDALIEPASVKVPALLEGLYATRGLPVAPGLFEALQECLAGAPRDARDGAAIRLIEGAAGIATKLLQVATWTRLGVREAPATVGEAYHQLGAHAVAALLDSELLRPHTSAPVTPFHAAVWRRCERIGPVAGAIATAERLTATEASRVTLVALWSAAAPLLLDAVCQPDFIEVRRRAASTGTPLAELEREHFGLTATQACAHLLRLWGLSPVLAGWVAQSGDATALSAAGLSVDGLAHVAGAIVDALDGQAVPDATRAYVDRLNLTSRLDAWRSLAEGALDRAA